MPNMGAELTAMQMKSIDELFDKLSKDGGATIPKEKLTAALEALEFKEPFLTEISEKFKDDSTIDYDDFTNAVKPAFKFYDKEFFTEILQEAFDKAGTGKIKVDDLKHWLKDVKLPGSLGLTEEDATSFAEDLPILDGKVEIKDVVEKFVG